MTTDQPIKQPLEPVSFDDLQPEVLDVPESGGLGGPIDPSELPKPEGGSLKDRIIAQAKKEEADAAALQQAKDQTSLKDPAVDQAAVQPEAQPEATAPLPEPPPIPAVPESKSESKPEPKIEVTVETAPTEAEGPKPTQAQGQTQADIASTGVVVAQVPVEKTETRQQIESILQDGLGPMFLQMDPKERQAFTAAANETASKLEVLVTQFKASAREVLRLIKNWLSKIPKVNKYFLEQASKIKTDEILQVQAQKKKESRLLH